MTHPAFLHSSCRKLVLTIVYSLPSLFNVFCTAALVLAVYGVVAMNLFSGLRYSTQLTWTANFESFGVALLTLLRMSTGEAWGYIMSVSGGTVAGHMQ